MERPSTGTPLNAQIRAAASDWLLRFSEGEVGVGTQAREDFMRWLRASPEHVRAYLRICAFWQDAHQIQGRAHSDINALVQLAQQEANVVHFDSSPREWSRGADEASWVPPKARNRKPVFATAAASVLLLLGFSGWLYVQRNLYVTDIGEQRIVNLPDGSAVVINARSRVRVSFTAAERDVDLLEGQALFKVAKDPSRAFIVHSNGTTVRAVGTEFDVHRKDGGVVVTVVEGKVAVGEATTRSWDLGSALSSTGTNAPPPESVGIRALPGEFLLREGEQAIVSNRSAIKPPKPNVEAATAWTEGLLVFDGAPLSEVVEEFNRQNARPMVLLGAGLSDLKISGSFPASGGDRLVRFLQDRFQVRVQETGGEIRISRQ
jgi:transmembrane sensor